jgi:hypothetical protein
MANRHFNKQTTNTRKALAKGGPAEKGGRAEKLDILKELKESQTTTTTRPKPPKIKGK